MTNEPKIPSSRLPASRSQHSIFGPAPILEGEDAKAYDKLLMQVSTAVKPSDIIEDILTRDVVDFTWEIFRWRRTKTSILTSGVKHALADKLKPPPHRDDEEEPLGMLNFNFRPTPPSAEAELAEKWAVGNVAARARVKKLMAERNVTMDDVLAAALMNNIGSTEQIDRLIISFEMRRSAILRELDRRRFIFAQTLRGTIQKIEHIESKIVDADRASSKRATNKNAA